MTVSVFEFDRSIAIDPQGEGTYTAWLDGGWKVGGGLNGGYLLAVLGNAIKAEFDGHPDPYSISAYYLSPAKAGPAVIRVAIHRRGRGTSTARVALSQPSHDGTEEVDRITALATFGDLASLGDQPVLETAKPPLLPAYDQCLLSSEAPTALKEFVPMLDRFAMRLDPATSAVLTGRPSGLPYVQAWFELADGRPIDPIALLCVADTLPPVTTELGQPGWAPTVELTVHVRAIPALGPVRVRHETQNLSGRLFEEDCEVWDSADRLVARSRQLAITPRRAG